MKKTFIFIAVASLLTLISCSKFEQDLTISSEATPQEIAFKPFSGSMTKAAITTTTFPTDRKFKMSATYTPTEGTASEYFKGIEFSKGTESTWRGNAYWPLGTGYTLDFLAISAETDSHLSSVTWGVADTKKSSEQVSFTLADNSTNQDDVLAGAVTGATYNNSQAQSISFKHLESLICFSFKKTGDCTINIKKVTLNSHKNTGTCTVTRSSNDVTAAWTNTSGTSTKDYTAENYTIGTDNFVAYGSGYLVIPQTEVGFTITFTYTHGDVTSPEMTYAYTPTNAGTWAAGKKYTYQITISPKQIEVSPSITDWGTEDGGGNTSVTIPSAS